MFDLVDWFLLMCCWCCDRKDKDEEEFEISERESARQKLMGDLTDGATTETQPQKPPQLAHAPQILPENQRYYSNLQANGSSQRTNGAGSHP